MLLPQQYVPVMKVPEVRHHCKEHCEPDKVNLMGT